MITNLTKEDMKKIIDINDIIDANEEALKIYSSKRSVTPLRLNLGIVPNNGQSLYMPAYANGDNFEALGIKIVSVFPDNPEKYSLPSVPATMVLQNPKTGDVCCIMDGTFLTQLRTGALSGLASKYLSRKDSKTLLQIGVGGQAEAQIDAVLAVRDIDTVYLSSRNKDKTNAFSDFMSKKYEGIKFISTDSPNKYVSNADIINLVTTSKKPVIDGSLIKSGTHINSIGSYTPDMQETPVEVLQMSSKIYFDTYEGVIKESGDVLIPINNGFFSKDDITGEIGELLLGLKPKREGDDEITWFKSTGSAILDVVAAEKIYRKYKDIVSNI